MARMIPVGLLTLLMASPFQVQVTQRDQPPPQQQPTTRRIPVGTASIAGSVTAADTGRPIRGARVYVSGNLISAASRAGGPPAQGATAAPPAGSQGPGAVTSTLGISMGRSGSSGPATSMTMTSQVQTGTSRSATTDEQGSFLIDKLPAGQYTLNVSGPRNTFLPVVYGQKKPNGPPGTFALADGQRAKLDMKMIRGGVIVGTVFGEDGDPLIGSQIRAWRYTMTSGIRRLQSTGFATTDDRGMYRLYGLQPGDYLVSATPDSNGLVQFSSISADDVLIEQAIASGAVTPPAGPGLPATVSIPIRTPQQQIEQRQMEGPPPGYLPVFHPSTPVATGATTIHINGGDERTSVDIQVRLVQATNIQGTIENPPGEGLAVQLSLLNDDPSAENTPSARTDNNNRFTFRNIAPGKYTILAQVVAAQTYTVVNGSMSSPPPQQRQLDESQKWWGRTPVNVDGQPNITADVALKPGRTISGRVIFEMERPPDPSRQKMMVMLSQAPGLQIGMFSSAPQAEVAPDGTFTLKGVIPGKYVLRGPAGMAKSSIINGQDVLDFPLAFTGARDITDAVLTVTDKYSEVSGTLLDASGQPAPDYMIVAAAADQRFWTPGSRRIVVSRPTADGQYRLRGLPPGDYLIAAVTELENGGQYDPEFLKSLAGAAAMHISVVEGGKVSQDLRIVR